jgi:hypothetical protein
MLRMTDGVGSAMDRLRWGRGHHQSGYDFDAVDGTVTLASSDAFQLGTFTHIKNAIALGTQLAQAEYSLGFDVNGTPASWSTSMMFEHNETLNRCNHRANPHCSDDIVNVRAESYRGEFRLGSDLWLFTLLGFSMDGGRSFGFTLQSPEQGRMTSPLYARVELFREPVIIPPQVPETATFALF